MDFRKKLWRWYKEDQTNLVFELGNENQLLYIDEVEIKKQNSKIIYMKARGTLKQFNEQINEVEEFKIRKEYYNFEGFQKLIETVDGKEIETTLNY